MLGRVCLSYAPTSGVRKTGKAIAAPAVFRKDRLDSLIRFIYVVSCILLPLIIDRFGALKAAIHTV